jgi:hypothetical protein
LLAQQTKRETTNQNRAFGLANEMQCTLRLSSFLRLAQALNIE